MKIDNTNPRWLKQEKLGWKQGLHGIMNLSSGDCYTGAWKDDLKHGNGLHQNAHTLHVYEGEFFNNQRHGFGILSVPKVKLIKLKKVESLFQSVKKKSIQSGLGVAPELLKIQYSGNWKDGVKEGLGIEYFEGSVFQGQFKDDYRNGWGKEVYVDGRVYEGEYHNDKRHGQGIMVDG